MSNINSSNSKEGLLKDIRTLITLFSTNWSKNVTSVKPLQIALKDCKEKSNESIWNFNLENLIFRNIDLGVNARPKGINASNSDLSVQLTVKHSGRFINGNSLFDPLHSLSFCGVISGIYEDKENDFNLVSVMSSFHIDKGGGATKRNFIHPEYHLNFGGDSMTKAKDISFGNLLLVGSPRIAHFPVDAILAIDFIIKNFYEKKNHEKLTDLRVYKELQRNAQFRVWRPYVLSLSSHWESCLKDEFSIDPAFNPNLLLPYLC